VKGLVELVEGEAKKMPTPGLVVRLDGRDEKRRKRIVDNERLVEEHRHEQYQRII
jgi:deoxyadenosine/deoxycytidine kinase